MAKVNHKGLKAVSKRTERKPRTSWPTLFHVQTGKKDWAIPGSPCYNARLIDYTVHRKLPVRLIDKHPRLATELAVSSPRWGVAGKSGRAAGPVRTIAPPWAAGQLELRDHSRGYAVHRHTGERLGHVKLNSRSADLRLQKKFRNKGYGVEVATLVAKSHPNVAIDLKKEANWSNYYYRKQNNKRIRVRKHRA